MFISVANAQEAASNAALATPPSTMSGIMPLLLIFAVFYFLLIRPQQKKFKAHQNMVSALRKGDNVVTSGGIVGTITKVDNDNDLVHVEIADGVEIKVVRATVASVVTKEEAKAAAPVAKSKKKAA